MTKIALHELQIIDSHMSRLESELASLAEKRTLDLKLSELGRLGKISSDQAHLLHKEQVEQKALEDTIGVLTDKIGREEVRLYGGKISNPKELKGIEDEVKALKARRDRDETKLLEKIETTEALSDGQIKLNEQLQTARAEADLAQASFERASGDVETQISRSKGQREEILKAVAPDTLKLYDRLRNEKQGLAVAVLAGSTCGGCHVELPAQELDRIVAVEQVWRCPHCRRILVRRV